ncbi:SAM-dependent methyltransferase [Amycolatopsis jiangsuensis]|uniref:S-adenosyl-L-methionine-dependent methyltransferase n=1 Tax=Amycolatopsis jiangsuensis TaxID=1181879 RepID=A0A840IWZ7_9PSEU|nr:SAM-dependent methyltransferase [Amycolatopsis jiangsuensis]MBB4687311.1 methyltransferase (TIGR00027 family) [Amycolatopsis jiangsuensis]
MATPQREWDIVSSIGLTALGVAAGRAIETAAADRLIEDPFAAEFVRAAHPPRPMPTGPTDDPVWTAMTSYIGLRSRYFDDLVTGSAAPQVVILAAGLDARAHRLELTGRTVFEVDQPRVLEFKQEVLDSLAAQPRCTRHTVPADLREDWPAALEKAGFDRGLPTVWLAEGLLPYLPAPAEEQLFELVAARSAPGSRIGVERLAAEHLTTATDHMRDLGAPERLGVELSGLFSPEERRNPVDWLTGQGWQVEVSTPIEYAARHGRDLPEMVLQTMAAGQLVRADLP